MNQKALVLTFQKAVEGFLLHLHAEGYNQSTIVIYKWGLAKFAAYLLKILMCEPCGSGIGGIQSKGDSSQTLQEFWGNGNWFSGIGINIC